VLRLPAAAMLMIIAALTPLREAGRAVRATNSRSSSLKR